MQRSEGQGAIPPNTLTIGSFLHSLRRSRGLTMGEAALRAGLHRATLDRWEKGGVQPRLSELETLLTVLDANARQKQAALQLIDAPRALRQARSQLSEIARQSGMPPLPNGGDLLYALRMRRGLSRDEAACSVGVTGGTLRRWEKMELWPSIEQLHRLCYALGAQEEEIVALTLGRLSQKPHTGTVSLEGVRERFQDLKTWAWAFTGEYPLLDLTALQLEADAWPLALQSDAGKQLLIEIYGFHAVFLSGRERLVEAGQMAERGLELMENKLDLDKSWLYPVIVSARARALGGDRHGPKRGLERLRPWSSITKWPDMQAWMLADMSKYLSLIGKTEAALTLAEEACRVIEREGDEVEICLRRWNKASILLAAGRPVAALSMVEDRGEMERRPQGRIEVSLLRAEAYLEVDNLSEARDWLQYAQTDVENYHIEYWRPRVERLAARL